MLSAYEISLDSCRLGIQTYPVGKKLGHCRQLTSDKSFNFCSQASSTWWPVVLSDMNKLWSRYEAAGRLCCCGKCFAQWVAAVRAGQVQRSGFCGRDIGLVQPEFFLRTISVVCVLADCLCFGYVLHKPTISQAENTLNPPTLGGAT